MDVSSISLNRSTFEQRHKNVGYQRALYCLFALSLLFTLLWSSMVLGLENLNSWVLTNWGWALAAGILAAILLLVATFVSAARQSPLNLVVYLLFTIFFAYAIGYLCARDWVSGWQVAYYMLWILTAIAVAFAIYAMFTTNYMDSITALLVTIGVAVMVCFGFLVFTKLSFLKLILAMIPVIIFGYYLNYDIRRMVRGNIYDSWREDPVSGAVRIWLETVFVFCRLVELIGGMFYKAKH